MYAIFTEACNVPDCDACEDGNPDRCAQCAGDMVPGDDGNCEREYPLTFAYILCPTLFLYNLHALLLKVQVDTDLPVPLSTGIEESFLSLYFFIIHYLKCCLC